MAVKPDGAPSAGEAAAQRRWMITILITVVFGGFGAVMAYLSYANSNQPSDSTPGGSSPSSSPAASPASESSDDKGKPDKGKPDK